MRRWRAIVALLVALMAISGVLAPGSSYAPHRVDAETWLQGGTPLGFGETVNGALDDQTFRQTYTFTGRANEIVAISMTRLTGDLDPYLLLTDEKGDILALSDDDGPSTDAQIKFKPIPEDGRYFVIATRFGQELGSTSGEYALSLERVGGGVTEHTVLQYGDSVIGRITQTEPLIFYFLRAQRGDVINVTMRRTSGSLDPHLDVATADGIVLASNDDDPRAEGTLDAGIANYTILDDGVYVIVATRFGREAGDTEGSYVLSVTRTPPDELGTRPEEARLIDYGMALNATVDDTVPIRYFRFDGKRGDVIAATMTATSGNLDSLIVLADENLVELVQDDNAGGDRDARIVAYTLPANGAYFLEATRSGGPAGRTSGTFTLQLNGRPGIVGGRALEIRYGSTVSGQINDQNVSEQYVFFGQQGDVVQITMERASGDLDPLVTLYDSDRKQIAFDDDSGGETAAIIKGFVLPRDDTYGLVASRYERESGVTSGAYILTLELTRSGQ
jgi:hypothetical protein